MFVRGRKTPPTAAEQDCRCGAGAQRTDAVRRDATGAASQLSPDIAITASRALKGSRDPMCQHTPGFREGDPRDRGACSRGSGRSSCLLSRARAVPVAVRAAEVVIRWHEVRLERSGTARSATGAQRDERPAITTWVSRRGCRRVRRSSATAPRRGRHPRSEGSRDVSALARRSTRPRSRSRRACPRRTSSACCRPSRW